MAGVGERFGASKPKQFQQLGGKKVYQWTLDALLASKLFDEVILVVSPQYFDSVRSEVPPSVSVIIGGDTRQESSYMGLIACGSDTEIVLIHDGVRPFVSQRILSENIEKAIAYKAVDTCIPSRDTIVYAPTRHQIAKIPNRAEYLRGQTPQTFDYSLIMQAHEKTPTSHATDDCQLVLEFGHPIYIVEGEERNIKITTPFDMTVVQTQLDSFVAN